MTSCFLLRPRICGIIVRSAMDTPQQAKDVNALAPRCHTGPSRYRQILGDNSFNFQHPGWSAVRGYARLYGKLLRRTPISVLHKSLTCLLPQSILGEHTTASLCEMPCQRNLGSRPEPRPTEVTSAFVLPNLLALLSNLAEGRSAGIPLISFCPFLAHLTSATYTLLLLIARCRTLS